MKKTRLGNTLKPGDVVLTSVQFADSTEIKTRPAVVLLEEFANVVVAGVTSNLKMKGIPLSRNEGAIKDSVIKLNYIFTISEDMISRVIFHLSKDKKRQILEGLHEKLNPLKT